MDKPILSITQINEYVKGLLDRDFILNNIYIKGEISNFKRHSSGHMYFCLKDDLALIRCVMFRQHNGSLTFTPENGMTVIIKGYVSLYAKDGQYQFYAGEMTEVGVGSLFLAFEKLKQRLLNEGLFDEGYKKKIPFLPRKIAIVTSHTGAAVRDIIQIATRRYANVNLMVVPVRVQGTQAAGEIAEALDYLNTREDIDLIITGRGGGSIEELWAFNEEKVARSIFRSRIPVISAVGHETDFTIADFVSDLRAPTPSAAAELAIPQKPDLEFMLLQLKRRANVALEHQLSIKRQQLEKLAQSSAMTRPLQRIDQEKQSLDHVSKYLEIYFKKFIARGREKLQRNAHKLNALSPLAVLGRGYSLIQHEETGKILKGTRDFYPDQRVEIRLRDGQVTALVESVRVDEKMEDLK